jgi:NADH-quinone oxidoreductase subunit I
MPAIIDIVKGLGITFSHMLKKPDTVSYPEEQRFKPPRTRGRHVLHRYEDGKERCIGCMLCSAACPANAIYIEAEENDPAHPVSPGERYARVYEIDMLRCIFCGMCEQACPTGAVTLEQQTELASKTRMSMVYSKEMLLEPLGQSTRGSILAWAAPPPSPAVALAEDLVLPENQGAFDGTVATAASVGKANLPATAGTEHP